MAATTNVRIPSDVHAQTTKIAALLGETPGSLLAKAWDEYFSHNRENFAAELEIAATIVRKGKTEDLAEFVAHGAEERANAAVDRIRAARG